MPPIVYQPFSSQSSPSFWSAVNSLKLDKQGLDDSQLTISAWYEEGRSVKDRDTPRRLDEDAKVIGIDGSVSLGAGAFGGDGERPPADSIPMKGVFKNFNTVEAFRDVEAKKKLFNEVVDSITLSSSFISNDVDVLDTLDLNPFLLVTFADLKKYVYHYWFAFPAVVQKPGWDVSENGFQPVTDEDVKEIRALGESLVGPNRTESSRPHAFFVKGVRGQKRSFSESTSHLSGADVFFREVQDEDRFVVFHDPSSLPEHPGWPLRNILYYLKQSLHISAINVICLRAGSASRKAFVTALSPAEAQASDKPQTTGWERNKAGKLVSRVADLGPMMDPSRWAPYLSASERDLTVLRLADQAVDLNLKLMRWRILPSLQLEKIAATKCLLLGAGTLGCYVARALMGWGIRNITFVDSSRVSYSNPVRQPLFDFEDCLDGGKPKAQTAAERLKRIFPGVNATAHEFTIPMPGHPIPSSSRASTESDVIRLEGLIQSHDAVFLLMDSRESRWLPTVIGTSEGKIVINAALGFDSYLVMRHGARPDEEPGGGKRLGCYYCNDIVAPTDSLSDRTLDQMCTVTRPGIAPIASATAVELLVSLVQHPLGIHAPAETGNDERPESSGSPLGAVPHQLRGQLSAWRTMLIEGAAYDKCTGCSQIVRFPVSRSRSWLIYNQVVDAYRTEGLAMLLRAFNEPDYLEKLTGLHELHKESEAMMNDVVWEGDSEGSF